MEECGSHVQTVRSSSFCDRLAAGKRGNAKTSVSMYIDASAGGSIPAIPHAEVASVVHFKTVGNCCVTTATYSCFHLSGLGCGVAPTPGYVDPRREPEISPIRTSKSLD